MDGHKLPTLILTDLSAVSLAALVGNALGASPVAFPSLSATTTPETDEPHQRSPNEQIHQPPLSVTDDYQMDDQAPQINALTAFISNPTQENRDRLIQSRERIQSESHITIKAENMAFTHSDNVLPFRLRSMDGGHPAIPAYSATVEGRPYSPTTVLQLDEHAFLNTPLVIPTNSHPSGTHSEDYKPIITPTITHIPEGPVFPAPAYAMCYHLAAVLAEIAEHTGGCKYEEAQEVIFQALHPQATPNPKLLEALFSQMGQAITNTIKSSPEADARTLFSGPLKSIAEEAMNDYEEGAEQFPFEDWIADRASSQESNNLTHPVL